MTESREAEDIIILQMKGGEFSMTTCKKQPRLVDSTTIEAIKIGDLEYSLREGLKAALSAVSEWIPDSAWQADCLLRGRYQES